ncbi:four helix bundle protein [Candidatus Woesearchaeota archaeon]|nr:four helix bundle protein [Candidatus Woesearchaeota archaeon]
MARNYKKYIIYQKSYKLVITLYKITDKFPAHEINNITNQIRRSAVSVPLNIAEGSAKKSSREFLNFLNIAYGSAKELAVLLDLSKDLGYIRKKDHSKVSNQLDVLNKKIFLFIRHLEKEHIGSSFFQKYNLRKDIEKEKDLLYSTLSNNNLNK